MLPLPPIKIPTLNAKFIHKFVHTYVARPANIDHVSAKNSQFSSSLLYHNLRTIYTNAAKIFATTAEFNRLSFAIYRNEILYSEWKILVKI